MATYTKIMNQEQVKGFYDEVAKARKITSKNASDAAAAKAIMVWGCMLTGSVIAPLTAEAIGTVLVNYASEISEVNLKAWDRLGAYFDTLCINPDIDLVKFQVSTKVITISNVKYTIPYQFVDLAYHSISKGWIPLY